jgi:hypothetical protein
MARMDPSWIEISTFEGDVPGESERVADENEMPRRGDGKKFRQPFDDAENDRELRAPVHHNSLIRMVCECAAGRLRGCAER